MPSHRDLTTLTVGDVMTPSPKTLGPDSRLSEAWELMDEHNFMHVPVVDGDRLVGLLSERHVRDAMPSVLTLSDPEGRKKALHLTRVSQVMLTAPKSLAPTTLLRDAIKTMRRYKAGSLPIVDRGHLVGILTAGDLITVLERILSDE
jgi:acetoin utilization protein AcuB